MTPAPVRAPGDVARDVFDAVCRRDPDGIVANAAEDCVDDFVAIGRVDGKAAIRRFFVDLFAAFPDFTMTVDRIVADDEAAVVQWHARATFTGALFEGIRATGRRVEVRGADVMEVRDGLLRHNTIYYDGAGFARQLGVLPPRGSVPDRALLAAFNAKTRLTRRRPG